MNLKPAIRKLVLELFAPPKTYDKNGVEEESLRIREACRRCAKNFGCSFDKIEKSCRLNNDYPGRKELYLLLVYKKRFRDYNKLIKTIKEMDEKFDHALEAVSEKDNILRDYNTLIEKRKETDELFEKTLKFILEKNKIFTEVSEIK